MSSPFSYDLQGQGGGIALGAGDAATGPFRWIQVVNDAVLGAISSSNIVNADIQLVSTTLPAGLGIGGLIDYIDVTSGLVIAYRS